MSPVHGFDPGVRRRGREQRTRAREGLEGQRICFFVLDEQIRFWFWFWLFVEILRTFVEVLRILASRFILISRSPPFQPLLPLVEGKGGEEIAVAPEVVEKRHLFWSG